MKKQYLVIGVVLLIVIGGIAWNTNKGGGSAEDKEVSEQELAEAGDPVDAVLAFYKPWLEAVQDPEASPYTSGLLDEPVLSAEMLAYLEKAQEEGTPTGVDPVLCQFSAPDKLRAKATFVLNDKAEVMVLGRGEEKLPEQAAV